MRIGIWRYFCNVLIIGVIACQNRTNLEKATTETIIDDFKKADAIGKNLDQINKDNFTPPIDILEIKKRFSKYSTSGVLPESENKKFPEISPNGFLGFYELLDREQNEIRFIGELIVFVSDTPDNWRFDSNKETFIYLKLVDGTIKIWNRIGIGTMESDVREFISGNFHYKKGTTIYCEFGDYSIVIIMNDGKVKELEVCRIFKS